jgi:hypothetical protein
MRDSRPLAIVLIGVFSTLIFGLLIFGPLIRGAITFGPRWEIAASAEGVYRLDKQTGEIVECWAPEMMKQFAWSGRTDTRYHCGPIPGTNTSKLPTAAEAFGPAPAPLPAVEDGLGPRPQ